MTTRVGSRAEPKPARLRSRRVVRCLVSEVSTWVLAFGIWLRLIGAFAIAAPTGMLSADPRINAQASRAAAGERRGVPEVPLVGHGRDAGFRPAQKRSRTARIRPGSRRAPRSARNLGASARERSRWPQRGRTSPPHTRLTTLTLGLRTTTVTKGSAAFGHRLAKPASRAGALAVNPPVRTRRDGKCVTARRADRM
jgi:hypothetical protein